MFKKIPGNTEYRIDINGKVLDSAEKEIVLESVGPKMVRIELFGVTRDVSLSWLSCLSWYECGVISNLEEVLGEIYFLQSDPISKVRCGKIMQFKNPVYYKKGFRYIPPYPRYAISSNGILIDTLTNGVVSGRVEIYGYVQAHVYNPDKCSNRNTPFHRLLAFAWLPNTDFLNKPIINHINGVKSDNDLQNLEWCSYTHNARHAVVSGLLGTPVKMKARDVLTGEVSFYDTASELNDKLGLSRGYSSMVFSDRKPGHLYKGRYEVKIATDDSPWHYEGREFDSDEVGSSHYLVTVRNRKTGEIKKYGNMRKFRKLFGLWTTSTNIDDAMTLFKERHPDLEASYVNTALRGPYQVLDVVEKKVSIVSSIPKVEELTGRNRNELKLDLRRGRKFIYSGKWIVSAGLEKIIVDEYREKPRPYNGVMIKDWGTGLETAAKSVKHAAKLTGVTPRAITLRLADRGITRNFSFRPIGQECPIRIL